MYMKNGEEEIMDSDLRRDTHWWCTVELEPRCPKRSHLHVKTY